MAETSSGTLFPECGAAEVLGASLCEGEALPQLADRGGVRVVAFRV